MKICAFGGCFDPPHIAHLKIALAAIEQIRPDIFYFIPGKDLPHAKRPIATVEARVEMLNAVCAHVPNSHILRYELDREDTGFTIDTVIYLRKIHPRLNQLYWIIGSDWVEKLDSWKNIEKLRSLCQIVVFKRPSYPINSETELQILNLKPMDISSLEIRNKEYKYLENVVLPEVAQLIRKKGYYNVW